MNLLDLLGFTGKPVGPPPAPRDPFAGLRGAASQYAGTHVDPGTLQSWMDPFLGPNRAMAAAAFTGQNPFVDGHIDPNAPTIAEAVQQNGGHPIAAAAADLIGDPTNFVPLHALLGLAALAPMGKAAMGAGDLARGLERAGVSENLARLPGVQQYYGRALRNQAEGLNLLGLIDSPADVVSRPPRPSDVPRFSEQMAQLTEPFGAPSLLDLQGNVDAILKGRQRMAVNAQIALGKSPEEAATAIAKMDPRKLPDSTWYETTIRPLQQAVEAGADPAATRALFDAHMGLEAANSARTSVKSQVTRTVNTWLAVAEGRPVEEAVRGMPNQVGAQRGVLLEGPGSIGGQKYGSFEANTQGRLRPVTKDTHDVRNGFISALEGTGINIDSPEFKQNMADVLGLWGKKFEIGSGKARHTVVLTPENFAQFSGFDYADNLANKYIFNTSRYRLYEQAAQDAADTLGIYPATGQATRWVGFGNETNVASGADFTKLLNDGIHRLAQTDGLTDGEAMKQFLHGKLKLKDAIGPGAAAAFLATIWGWDRANQEGGVY